MKITFEGQNLNEVATQMHQFLCASDWLPRHALGNSQVYQPVDNSNDKITEALTTQGPSPEAQGSTDTDASIDEKGTNLNSSLTTPKRGRPKTKAPAPKEKLETQTLDELDPVVDVDAAPTPAEIVAIRQKTIDELQAAYAGGKQKAVFDLLNKHGNGAKSFRELAPEAFLPIRKAIDQGALA